MRLTRTAAVGVLAGGLLAATAFALPASAAPLSLPAPTGSQPVGVRDFHLVDADRADPWEKPLMLLGAPHHAPDGEYGPKWTEVLRNHDGWERWFTVEGTGHSSFTDYAPIADQLGIPLGTTPGDRVMEITRSLVGAFADRHLRGIPSPVLNHSCGEVTRW